jgi:predicted HAD superfamily phosphohydrolase YqeG
MMRHPQGTIEFHHRTERPHDPRNGLIRTQAVLAVAPEQRRRKGREARYAGAPMIGRVSRVSSTGLDDLESLVDRAHEELVLVVDADNTLVPQGADLEVFRSGVTAAIERFTAHPNVARIVVLTNGPDRGVPSMIHRGNKPWTTRRRLGLDRGDRVWVVGDQILTDGILARRLGATFVHLAIDVTDEDPRQAIMRRIGRWLRHLLFRD